MAINALYPEDIPLTGEVPGGPELLREPALEHYHRQVEERGSMLPSDHEITTKLDDNGTEIPAKNIKLSLGQKAHEYTATIIREVAGHPKEVTAATLTVAGLLAAVGYMHARRKAK